MQVGIKYNSESNKLKDKKSDTLNAFSYAFSVWELYVRSNPEKANRWGVSYFSRTDHLPTKDKLVRADRSDNYNLFTDGNFFKL